MKTTQIVEAVLFASDAPLDASEIARADPGLDEDEVERALQALKAEYEDADRAFEVQHIAEGYQILTRSEFAPYLERFDTVPRPNRLSGPALEALAIIAYRQPIGRIEMEYIRGVSSAGVIRTLVERSLVDVVGRDEGVGRPLLYGTTKRFLEHFGFASLEDLPRPDELPVVLRDRVAILPVAENDEVLTEDESQESLELTGSPSDPMEVDSTAAAVPEAPSSEAATPETPTSEAEAPEAPTAEAATPEARTSDAAIPEPVGSVDSDEGTPDWEPESV